MKKFISLLTVFAILACGFVFPAAAEETATNDVIISSCEGAAFELDSYLNAYKITPNATGENVIVSFEDINGAIAVWVPYTYGAEAGIQTLNVEIATNDDNRSTELLTPSYKFGVIAPMDSSSITELSFTPETTDDIYIYSQWISGNDTDTIAAVANGSLEGFTEEELLLDCYEVDRYTDYFWAKDQETKIVYNESFYPLADENGAFPPKAMMYDIDRVVSVQDSFLEVEYTYGRDYLIEDGKLVIPEGSAIALYDYSQVYKDSARDSGWWETIDGTYVFAGQYNMYFTGYLNITYTTSDTWDGAVPESKAIYLENSLDKLRNGAEEFKLLAIGDSISGGANVSADLEVEPYADVWSTMTAKALQEKYPGTTITYDTIAQGGATASLAIEKMSEILAFAPDLLLIEFGTNECMQGDSATIYTDTLKQAIAAVNENLPDCDIVLLAPYFSNPLLFPADWFYSYADSLYALERDGVAVCDIVSIIQYVLTQKDYLDITGDNLCHPNDFTSRIIAQTVLATLEDDPSEANYIIGLADRILHYRYENEFYPAEWETVTALQNSASEAILAADSASSALALFIEKAAEIDAVPNARDVDASAALDCASIIYNNAKAYETLTGASNISTRYDDTEKALILTISYARNPIATINYTVGDAAVNADDYDYAVITARVPDTNGSRSTASKLTYTTEGGTTSSYTVSLTRDDKYHSYIVDLSNDASFAGTISTLNYTTFSSSSAGDELYISSIILAKDTENAKDIAIERERSANADAAEAYTLLMSDDAMCSILESEGGDTYLAGDANGDGELTAKDAVYLRRNLAGYDDEGISLAALDLDQSGAIEVTDCIIIRQMLVGLLEKVTVGTSDIQVSYDEEQEAAKLVLTKDNASVSVDMTEYALSADMFKYVTLCAKAADGSALSVNITLTTESGAYTYTVGCEEIAAFTADSGKFVDALGSILSVEFTFNAASGSVIYFDSFVLTPTLSAAENAEVVRVGAANLI